VNATPNVGVFLSNPPVDKVEVEGSKLIEENTEYGWRASPVAAGLLAKPDF